MRPPTRKFVKAESSFQVEIFPQKTTDKYTFFRITEGVYHPRCNDTQSLAPVSYLDRSSNIPLCTYPKWAIGHVGSSPDNRNCMFDWLNWHIGTGKHTVRFTLYLDINRVSFSILKSREYKQKGQVL